MATHSKSAGEALKLAEQARKLLDGKKGSNIVLLDVRGKSGIADYFLIASGASTPHLKALADEVQLTLKHEGTYCFRRAGTAESGWVTLDYIDVIIHIFLPAVRSYYSFEDLWE